MTKTKKAYILFNCDVHQSPTSMNPLYNSKVYRDTRDSRRQLWKDLQIQLKNGWMELDDTKGVENIEAVVRKTILTGAPADVNQYLKYGFIAEMNCY